MIERPNLMTIQEVANFLSVPVKTIYDWRTKNYGPPAKKIGRYLRYDPDAVLHWLDELDDSAA